MASVDVRNLRKIYKRDSQNIVVLDGMNLQVPDGEFVALRGPSGPASDAANCIARITGRLGTVTVAARCDLAVRRRAGKWAQPQVGFIPVL